MQSSLKKSLYLGLAALSFASVAAVSTTASAKSAAKVTSDKVLTTDATKRNVNLTGTNAIYTKPGTVKGAKVVATTTTAKNLNKSTTSHENFRAYRVAKTNRGSIYYKVVSYNKVYRGWVYGGKSATAFAGGLTSYDTFKEGTLTADQKTGTYKLANPGKTEAGLTYKQPAWTQYKIGKTIADTTAYKDATFSVDKVGTRTREGDTWVHVVNQNTADTKADGWILLSNLTQTNAFDEQSQVKVVIKDTDGNTIKEFNYTAPDAKGKDSDVTSDFYTTTPTNFSDTFNKAVQAQVSGTGYTVAGTDTVNQSAKVLTGSTLNLVARKGDTVSMKVQPWAVSATPDHAGTHLTLKTTDTPTTTATNYNTFVTASATMTTPFSGVEGQTFTSTDLVKNLTANKLNTLTSVKYAKVVTGEGDAATTTYVSPDTDVKTPGIVKDGDHVQLFQTVYTLSGGVPGTFAKDGIAQALYTANEVKTTASATTPDAGNGSLFG
ncbi:S-layer protein [Levilactobacillus brevis]|uniref:S-layer protein n=1 Tax=Levilactobacillus brevis TaxID=1580 RepID=UPI002277578C|nr:S-layer protein [Levilactobacillus brevis]WAE44811.1 S-layer protein [Levilactobacillus brevis]